MKDDSRDELDDLLDSALASYSNQQPRLGLEARVLAKLEDATAARQWRIPRWLWAMPALVLLGIVVIQNFYGTSQKATLVATPESPARIAPPPKRTLANSSAAMLPRIPAKRKIRTVNAMAPYREPLPKREQFPSSSPLTSEEKALLLFVTRAPREVDKWVAEHKKPVSPLQFRPVEIAPLETGQ